jgi:hypothetical protein
MGLGGGVYRFDLVHLWKISSLFSPFSSQLIVRYWIQFSWILCLVVSLGLFLHLPLFF